MKAEAEAPLSQSWAFAFLSIPFKDRGTGWDGCDCWNFCVHVYKVRLGIDLKLYREIETVEDPAAFKTFVRESAGPEWLSVIKGQEQPYDIVLMRGEVEVEGRKAMRPVHVGVVVKPGTLIHIEKGIGVSISDYRNHQAVKHRVLGFYRYVGEAAA